MCIRYDSFINNRQYEFCTSMVVIQTLLDGSNDSNSIVSTSCIIASLHWLQYLKCSDQTLFNLMLKNVENSFILGSNCLVYLYFYQ